MSKEESWIISIGKLHTTIYNQDQKILDLEAKLAESEKKILELQEDSIRDNQIYNEQLAEKELVLDKILTEIHTNCYSGLNIVKFKEMVLNDLGSVAIKHNQDKISFAVEQLEKVKGKIQHNILFVNCDDYVNVIEEIDNQIKAIKEGK